MSSYALRAAWERLTATFTQTRAMTTVLQFVCYLWFSSKALLPMCHVSDRYVREKALVRTRQEGEAKAKDLQRRLRKEEADMKLFTEEQERRTVEFRKWFKKCDGEVRARGPHGQLTSAD